MLIDLSDDIVLQSSMIIEEQTHRYSVDIGRPTFYTDEDKVIYKKVFELIETCPIPIVVNGAYDFVRKFLYEDSGGYGGGGFAFCFFFATKEDRKEFARLMKEIGFNITDWRNVMFYQDLDKKLHVRFDEKYLPFAQAFVEDTTLTVGPYMVPKPPMSIEDLNNYYDNESKEKVPVLGLHLASGELKDVLLLKTHLDEQFLDFEPILFAPADV